MIDHKLKKLLIGIFEEHGNLCVNDSIYRLICITDYIEEYLNKEQKK